MPAPTYSQQIHQKLKDCLQRGSVVISGVIVNTGMKAFPTGLERLKWGIKHYSAKWGDSIEYYTDIDECVDDFLALLKAKDVGSGAQ